MTTPGATKDTAPLVPYGSTHDGTGWWKFVATVDAGYVIQAAGQVELWNAGARLDYGTGTIWRDHLYANTYWVYADGQGSPVNIGKFGGYEWGPWQDAPAPREVSGETYTRRRTLARWKYDATRRLENISEDPDVKWAPIFQADVWGEETRKAVAMTGVEPEAGAVPQVDAAANLQAEQNLFDQATGGTGLFDPTTHHYGANWATSCEHYLISVDASGVFQLAPPDAELAQPDVTNFEHEAANPTLLGAALHIQWNTSVNYGASSGSALLRAAPGVTIDPSTTLAVLSPTTYAHNGAVVYSAALPVAPESSGAQGIVVTGEGTVDIWDLCDHVTGFVALKTDFDITSTGLPDNEVATSTGAYYSPLKKVRTEFRPTTIYTVQDSRHRLQRAVPLLDGAPIDPTNPTDPPVIPTIGPNLTGDLRTVWQRFQ